MAAALQRAWLRRGALACLLLPVAALYLAIAALHRFLYASGLRRTWRAPVPVIVVGNVVAGGAGKTPVVIALAQHLQRRGLTVGVVSRGHGRRARGCREVRADADPAEAGDEPLLIAQQARVPVVVGASRVGAIRLLLQRNPGLQVAISDDGLQHWALARDFEIVVFDDRGTGNGWLLPAGPLRERWPRRADAVIRTPAAPAMQGFVSHRKLADHGVTANGTKVPLQSLAHGACVAMAGIAQPEAFFTMLRHAGVDLVATFSLADHHRFDSLPPGVPAGATILCTQKDAAKLWKLRPDAIAIPLQLDIDAAFWQSLDRWLDAQLSSAHGCQAA